ncbi:MAG TPA: ATP-grasp domain-containing protein [Methylotenera sp.]|nr:ATP-grasp domain-containing protein [Methylotenera sp.]
MRGQASLLVIALSARPYVEAAKRAGYAVTAIDGFADKQTVELADKTIVVDFDSNGFEADALLSAIQKLDASQYLGFVYGSGLDAQPEQLEKIASVIPLIGNSAASVKAVKTASSFFAALKQSNITYPPVFDSFPTSNHADVYLRKFAGGCGGMHIKLAGKNDELAANHYYQQYVDGYSVSLLFLANGEQADVVGFNEQWLSPSEEMPFRYGGAVSHIVLPQLIQQQLIDAASKLTVTFGLFGLNSLDAIVQRDIAYVLEINPRLSATFDLYENVELNLMDLHVDASLMQLEASSHCNQPMVQSKAHAIVYAPFDMMIPAAFDWPDWAVDTPMQGGQSVKLSAPICTVIALASNTDSAKQLAQTRVKMLLNLLQET